MQRGQRERAFAALERGLTLRPACVRADDEHLSDLGPFSQHIDLVRLHTHCPLFSVVQAIYAFLGKEAVLGRRPLESSTWLWLDGEYQNFAYELAALSPELARAMQGTAADWQHVTDEQIAMLPRILHRCDCCFRLLRWWTDGVVGLGSRTSRSAAPHG